MGHSPHLDGQRSTVRVATQSESLVERRCCDVFRTDLDTNSCDVQLPTLVKERGQERRAHTLAPELGSDEEIVDDARKATKLHAVFSVRTTWPVGSVPRRAIHTAPRASSWRSCARLAPARSRSNA